MNTFLAHSKLHFFWSSFALCLTFTFIIFYSSNPFQTKHLHGLLQSPKDDIAGACSLIEGKWVRDTKVSLYTNRSCATIPDSKNCFKHGRVDTEFLNWRWKPNGCELPRFDPANFFRIVRGKTMGFIGDSVSRNHADSLICQLSEEEVPMDVYTDSNGRFRTWHFPIHDFTLVTLWSQFLVAADEVNINGSNSGIFNLHLDKVDHHWADQLHTLDYAIISGGHWFFRPLYLYQDNIKIGCVYCTEPNTNNHDSTYALRMSFRTTLSYINHCKGCKRLMTLLRTFSPSHFENGTWNNGGKCNRIRPLREFEVESSEFYGGISGLQHEEIEKARKECLVKNKRFEVLDITRVMATRADGHPGAHWGGSKWMKGYNDCVHWCLPGPIDIWNDFLMAYLTNYDVFLI